MTETRTLEDGRSWLLTRCESGTWPLVGLDRDVARAVITQLEGLDPKSWTDAWGGAALRFAEQAETQEPAGSARDLWQQAYRFAFLARYPTPNHPLKQQWYDRTREYFYRGARLDDPAVEVVTVPFESTQVRFYVTRPSGPAPAPVVMAWGGIDTWKEEMYGRLHFLRARGFALVLVDMPGVGESPVLASTDAERQWTPVLDWIADAEGLDEGRVAALGASFGGYWAMKLAYTHRERLQAAVNWGGGVHITFSPEWQAKSRDAASYLMDLMAARAAIFGKTTFEEYIAECPQLSLLDQGMLDLPSAPLLLVNGRDDVQNTIEDVYLSLQYGDPKSARVFPGGHMGVGPTDATIEGWLSQRLRLP